MKDLGRDDSVGRLLERALRTRVAANSPDACPDADTLAAWTDGALAAGEQASVEAHAADCARCQAQLAAMVRMTPAEIPQSALKSAVRNPRSAVRAAAAGRWLVPGAAAAAALALWVWVQPAPPPMTRENAAQVLTPPPPAAEPPSPRGAEPPARAEAPQEEKRAVDSIMAERQREQDAAGDRALTTRSADARRERASVNAPAMATAPAAPAALAESGAARALEIVSPDPAIRWRVSGSTIQRSTDTGRTWQPQSAGVDAPLTAGASPQPSVCWLVGRAGIVLLSTDGRIWRRLPFPEAVDLVGIKASSASSASVTTADGRILATADAGATWRRP